MPFFIPGATPTSIPESIPTVKSYDPWWSLQPPFFNPSPSQDLVADAFSAFGSYTFGGPIELMAGKSIGQGVALSSLVGTGVYRTIGSAIAFEVTMDFLLVGLALTLVDPANKWGGGLDDVVKGAVESDHNLDWSAIKNSSW